MTNSSDIGAELSRARESRGWSHRDVAHHTRIPVHIVEKLENNDYRSFPSPAYAKSFLAQYSRYLDVEADEWLETFQTGNPLANLGSYEYLKPHDEHLGEEPLPVPPKRLKKKTAPAPVPVPSETATTLQPLVVFLITAGFLTAGAFGYLRISERAVSEDLGTVPQKAPGFVEAPSMVHSRPAPRRPVAPNATAPIVAATETRDDGMSRPAIGVATQLGEDAATVRSFDAPPPRAVIVEE